MAPLKNPLVAAREKAGLTTKEMALVSGLDASAVSQNEIGTKARPTPALLAALAKLGFDPAELTAQYAEWRKAQGEAILARRVASV